MKDLELNGFYILKNKISINDLEYLDNSIIDNLVNYSNVQSYINNNLIQIINKSLNWDIIYCKYRVSNNNNSSDASVLHRDFINYKDANNCLFTKHSCCPCYTIIIYLDNTTMELIQYSHLQPNMSISTAFKNFYKNKIHLNLEIGDILIINSSILHRGIFSNNKNNRKVIQIFDVFKNKIDFNKYSNLLIHIPTNFKEKSLLRKIIIETTKNKFITNLINFIVYFNAACGYNYNTYHNDKYYSSEGSQNRLIVIPNTFQEDNKYIICQNIISLINNNNNINYLKVFILKIFY